MVFLEQTDEKDSQFYCMRLLALIKDDKYADWEKLMALNVMKLYLNKIQNKMESQGSF